MLFLAGVPPNSPFWGGRDNPKILRLAPSILPKVGACSSPRTRQLCPGHRSRLRCRWSGLRGRRCSIWEPLPPVSPLDPHPPIPGACCRSGGSGFCLPIPSGKITGPIDPDSCRSAAFLPHPFKVGGTFCATSGFEAFAANLYLALLRLQRCLRPHSCRECPGPDRPWPSPPGSRRLPSDPHQSLDIMRWVAVGPLPRTASALPLRATYGRACRSSRHHLRAHAHRALGWFKIAFLDCRNCIHERPLLWQISKVRFL